MELRHFRGYLLLMVNSSCNKLPMRSWLEMFSSRTDTLPQERSKTKQRTQRIQNLKVVVVEYCFLISLEDAKGSSSATSKGKKANKGKESIQIKKQSKSSATSKVDSPSGRTSDRVQDSVQRSLLNVRVLYGDQGVTFRVPAAGYTFSRLLDDSKIHWNIPSQVCSAVTCPQWQQEQFEIQSEDGNATWPQSICLSQVHDASQEYVSEEDGKKMQNIFVVRLSKKIPLPDTSQINVSPVGQGIPRIADSVTEQDQIKKTGRHHLESSVHFSWQLSFHQSNEVSFCELKGVLTPASSELFSQKMSHFACSSWVRDKIKGSTLYLPTQADMDGVFKSVNELVLI